MKNTPRRANYTIATIKTLLGFAVRCGLRSNNPASGIQRYREYKRERFLTVAEIGAAADAIMTAESDGVIGPFAASGLRLALFTGARSGEITATKWDHVDWQRRLIRLPDSKTNEPRTIHLSDAAVEVLRNVPRVGPYVIAGARHGKPFKSSFAIVDRRPRVRWAEGRSPARSAASVRLSCRWTRCIPPHDRQAARA